MTIEDMQVARTALNSGVCNMGKCKNCLVGLFGGCRLDYCSAEREGLIEEAEQSAERHGHALAAFIKVRDYPIWQARCIRCGRSAAINLDPAQGEPDVYGEAVTADCLEADTERTREGSGGEAL